MININR